MLKFLSRLCSCALLVLPLAGHALPGDLHPPFAYYAGPGSGSCIVTAVVVSAGLAADSSQCLPLDSGPVNAVELLPNGTALLVATSELTLKRFVRGSSGIISDADTLSPAISFNAAPQVLAATPDSSALWVGLSDSSVLTRVNLADNTRTSLDIGFVPGLMLINSAGTRLFVAEKNGSKLAAIDLSASPLTAPTPWTLNGPAASMTLDASATRLFVSIPGSNLVTVRSTSNGAEVGTLAVTAPGAVLVNGPWLYAAAADSIQVWASDTLAAGTDLGSSGTAQWLAVSNDGSILYAVDTAGQWRKLATNTTNNGLLPPPARFFGPYPSTFQFSSASYSEMENVGDTTTITIVRRGDTTAQASVNFATFDLGNSNDYAKAGLDYEAVNHSVTFAAGVSQMVVPVHLLDDQYFGNAEMFGLRLSLADANTEYSQLGAPAEAPMTIENDDEDPRNRSGCSLGHGQRDPLLPVMLLAAGLGLLARRRHTT